MTGTGTSSDPYIVDNWDDFLAICNTQVYIKWSDSDNRLIDFNDINPMGYTETLVIDANVDFNGWTFRNYYYCGTGVMISLLSGSAVCGIQNLNFHNFYYCPETESTDMYAIYIPGTNAHAITDSTFSGKCIFGSSTSYDHCVVYIGSESVDLRRCSFNLESRDICEYGAYIIYVYASRDAIIADCHIKSKITTSYYNWKYNYAYVFQGGFLSNSLIDIDFTSTTSAQCKVHVNGGSSGTVFLINSKSGAYFSSGNTTTCIFNSDLITGTITNDNNYFKPCTNAQMIDADYLNSIGFPIGAG